MIGRRNGIGKMHALFVFILMFCSQELVADCESGVSLELAKQRRDSISNLNYSLSFSLHPSAPIIGGVAIDFTLSDKTGPVVVDFNANAAQINSLSVNDRPAKYQFKKGHILVSTETMEVGKNSIQVDFVAGDASLNRNQKYLYTLLVPDRASTVFPCFDQPDLKATYELQLELPIHWTASANAALERTTEVTTASRSEPGKTEKRNVLTYKRTKPISTYLFAFAAGEFEKITRNIDGREINLYHRESDTEKVARNIDKIFETHALSLNWMETYTQIPYPFEKFDFVLIPAFQYGGMEHTGNIFYNADQLFLDETATTDQKLGRASLIAHETAHMWFGNLVTMKWFNDVWLKEVFANFMAAKIVHPSFPKINHDLGFMMKHHPSAYGEDRSAGSNPIQQELGNLKDAGTLYGRIIYQKAPIVMRQLETMIGESKMRSGLQEYLKKFSYSNAVWDDLIEILDSKSDQDLKLWSDAWVKQPGTPEIASHIRTNAQKQNILTIRQVKKTPANQVWNQLVDVKVIVNGTIAFEDRVTIAGETCDVELPDDLGAYDFYLVNSSELGYGYFELDGRSQKYLWSKINTIEDDVLRGAAWLALFESLIRELPDDDNSNTNQHWNALQEAVRLETEPLNRQNVLNQIETLFWIFLKESDRNLLGALMESVLWSQIESESKDVSLDARSAYFKTLIAIATSRTTTANLYEIWESQRQFNGLKLSEIDYMELAYELALRLPKQADEILEKQLLRIRNEDRRRRFEFVRRAVSPQDSERKRFFDSLQRPENRRPERWVLEGVAYLHHPLRAKNSEPFVLPSLQLMEEIQATGDIFFPKRWLVATFHGHRSKAVADTIRQFLVDRPAYPENLKNKMLQAADLLLRMNPE